jgi:hypothetical protein
LKLWRETGDVVNHPRGVRGHVRRLDIKYLLELIHDIPDYFLDELVNFTTTNHFISVRFITIFNELECAGMSCKKLKCIASECNEELRATFIARMTQYDALEIGFIDEVSKDERTLG